jgi:cobalt transporter subunit CbtB
MDDVRALSVGAKEDAHLQTSPAWPTLIAAVLGAVIVFGVGFAGSETIHEAAHDARHSLNFPCH